MEDYSNSSSNGQCTDVLLSFLTDVGEDWSDSFIFPGSEVSHYIDIDDYLSKEEFQEHQDIDASTHMKSSSSSADISPASLTIVTQSSRSDDDEDFDNSIGNLFSDPFADEDEGLTLDDMFASAGGVMPPPSFSIPSLGVTSLDADDHRTPIKIKPEYLLQSSQIGLKRDRSIEPMVEDPRNVKATVPQKVTAVCSMLNQYRAVKKESEERDRKEAAKRFRYSTPIATATIYLQSLFNSTPVSPQELLKLSSSSSVLRCKALSSLVSNSQSKKAMAKLSAWMPASTGTSGPTEFPENHTGIGQTAAASRAFTSAMSDVLGHSVMSKLRFHAQIPEANAIISRYGDRLSAPFVFKSEGMVGMGYSEEIEFSGSITCDFVKEGVENASVYFDACKIIRDQHKFTKPLSTVAAVL